MLYLWDVLSADKIFVAMRNFWIGDTLGMITNFSAMTVAFEFPSKPRWRWSGHTLPNLRSAEPLMCPRRGSILGGALDEHLGAEFSANLDDRVGWNVVAAGRR